MKHIFAAIILILLFEPAFGQGLKADGSKIVDRYGNEVILRGIGLGGWMLQEPYMLQLSGIAMAQHDIKRKIEELVGPAATQAFYQSWLSNHCTKADIDSLAAWGFNSVRLPMHYNLFTLSIEDEPVKGAHTWLETGFELTDSLLRWCSDNKIYLILDLHAAPGGQGNDNAISDRDTSKPSLWQSELNRQKTIALWEKLAARYAGEEWIGAYDLINEPNWGFESSSDKNGCAEKKNEPLTFLLKQITAAIRKVDKRHMIIVEGNCWGNNYENMFPLWDDNMAVSFHKYWNNTDEASIQKFINYRETYKVPIWMGESGENSNAWFTDAIGLLERNKIGWAWWPLKKAGINNPLQVKLNDGYKKIIDYWKGKGAKPTTEEATNALMQFAADLRISNNIVRRDVIDAMMRQTQTATPIPFKSHSLRNELLLYATNYDLGNNGQAYYDVDAGNYWVSTNKRTDWNKGWQFRNDGVDITTCTDEVSNGYCVAWTEDGEWLQYTISATTDGWYYAALRYAAENKGGSVQFTVNDVISPSIDLTPTKGNNIWRTSAPVQLKIKKGTNVIRLLIRKGGFDLNYIQITHNDNSANTNTR